MTMSEHSGDGEGGRNALIAEYVLGLLDAREHARVERLIENDPALRAERDFWISRLGALNADFEDVQVPAHILAVIEARAFGDAPARPAGFWDSLMLWRSIAAGALAVAVVAIGVNVLQPRPDASALAVQLVAALEEEGSDVKFVALYDGATGRVRLTSLSGAVAPDRDFELWAIQGDNAPISMGVIPANARSEVGLSPEIAAGWGAGSVLAITLEPKGGSPSGDPTGPIVAKGAVTPI